MRHCAVREMVYAMVLIASTAEAQSGRTGSLQAAGICVGVRGSAYEGLGTGCGVDAAFRYSFPGRLSLGLGYQQSGHSFDANQGIATQLKLSGPLIELRAVTSSFRTKRPSYVSIGLTYMTQNVSVGAQTASASGWQPNIGGGVLIRLAPYLDVDAGATVGAAKFGRFTSGASDAGWGSNVTLHLGASWGIWR